jgi:hypothetical protein
MGGKLALPPPARKPAHLPRNAEDMKVVDTSEAHCARHLKDFGRKFSKRAEFADSEVSGAF